MSESSRLMSCADTNKGGQSDAAQTEYLTAKLTQQSFKREISQEKVIEQTVNRKTARFHDGIVSITRKSSENLNTGNSGSSTSRMNSPAPLCTTVREQNPGSAALTLSGESRHTSASSIRKQNKPPSSRNIKKRVPTPFARVRIPSSSSEYTSKRSDQSPNEESFLHRDRLGETNHLQSLTHVNVGNFLLECGDDEEEEGRNIVDSLIVWGDGGSDFEETYKSYGIRPTKSLDSYSETTTSTGKCK